MISGWNSPYNWYLVPSESYPLMLILYSKSLSAYNCKKVDTAITKRLQKTCYCKWRFFIPLFWYVTCQYSVHQEGKNGKLWKQESRERLSQTDWSEIAEIIPYMLQSSFTLSLLSFSFALFYILLSTLYSDPSFPFPVPHLSPFINPVYLPLPSSPIFPFPENFPTCNHSSTSDGSVALSNYATERTSLSLSQICSCCQLVSFHRPERHERSNFPITLASGVRYICQLNQFVLLSISGSFVWFTVILVTYSSRMFANFCSWWANICR